MLLSAVQCESVISIPVSPLSWASRLPIPVPLTQVITEPWAEPPVLYDSFPRASYSNQSCTSVSAPPPLCPTLCFPCCVHKSNLYVCTSVPALHMGSSVPFLSIPYISSVQWLGRVRLFVTLWTAACQTFAVWKGKKIPYIGINIQSNTFSTSKILCSLYSQTSRHTHFSVSLPALDITHLCKFLPIR